MFESKQTKPINGSILKLWFVNSERISQKTIAKFYLNISGYIELRIVFVFVAIDVFVRV